MLAEFINSFKSTILSTIDKDNNPFTSYAPYIKKNNKYYVYISSIAKHSKNLDSNPFVSLFFIEDEISCENIFGRKRVVLQCNVKKLSRQIDTFDDLIKEFELRHGATMNMLKAMKDFSIYEFTPFDGEAVFGFAQAYDVGGDNFNELIQREGLQGHK